MAGNVAMLQKEAAGEVLSRAFGLTPVCGRGTRYVALAGDLGLRWIIPSDASAAGQALAAWSPYKITSRLGWKVVTAAAKAGVLSYFPGAATLSVDFDSVDWDAYGWPHRTPPYVVAYVGTPAEQQKLVCTLVNRDTGQCEYVLKFPLGSTAREGMIRELVALRDLERRQLDVSPRVVREGIDTSFTVQTFVGGQPDWVRITKDHVNFLSLLVDAKRPVPLESLRERLQMRRKGLTSDADGRSRATIARLLDEGHWSGEIPSVRVHGDFAPWNLKRSTDGRIRAVDWEDSTPSGLPYFDLHHFRRSLAFRLDRHVTIPWQTYAEAVRRVAPGFSDEIASSVRTLAAIEHWFETPWVREANFEADQ
jgi:hypothetical protein